VLTGIKSRHAPRSLNQPEERLILSRSSYAGRLQAKRSSRNHEKPLPTNANAKADIASAITQASQQHKNIILAFGGDWCADCLVLDYYLHQPPNAQLLSNNFILVHVDIGQMDHNVDIANKYQVPIQKGVPALAVLNSTGTLLYAQQNKEFETLSATNIQSLTEFLNRWKS